MRTTITIPDKTFERAKKMAVERDQSLSSLISEFTARGVAEQGNPLTLGTDPATGLPTLSIGRAITAQEVAEAIVE
jgi:hypothetical protein